MNISDELLKVAELRREGHLTEEEFAEAKRQILSQGNVEPKTLFQGQDKEGAEDPGGMDEMAFYSSRLTSGNIFFPDAVFLQDDCILFQKASLFGSREEHINYKAVASFRITNGIFFSTITIETTGGSQPIVVNGLWKSDAKELQDILREYQVLSQRHG
jgi:Bacterial PH domain